VAVEECLNVSWYYLNMNKLWVGIFKRWILTVFVATVLAGLTYAAVQQSYRQSANDPQIQMVEDASTAIASGMAPQSVIASSSIDIAQSLAPYMVVYDASGTPVAGNGMLNGALPSLPSGIFAYVSKNGEDRVTWEPESGVRSAIVVMAITIKGGSEFVMAGRSLREVEFRENALEEMVDVAWILLIIGSLCLETLFAFWVGA
jgi:hypothetical protein